MKTKEPIKFVTRFDEIIIGTKQIWNKKRECLETINLWGTKMIGFTPLTKKDVLFYFRNLMPKSKKHEFDRYCARCGILIGEQYKNKKLRKYKGFLLCKGCYNKKRNNCKEATPDIEDIKRFKIDCL